MRSAVLVLLLLGEAGTARAWPISGGEHEVLSCGRRLLASADAALGQQEPDGAALALALAAACPSLPGLARAWGARGATAERARVELAARRATLAARIAAVRGVAATLRARDLAQAALDAAKAVSPVRPEGFDAAIALARACVDAAAAPGADATWAVGATSLAGEAASCEHVLDASLAARDQAARDLAEANRALRPLLHGERLAVYLEHGAPRESGPPAEVARARSWTFVEGPSGPLRTFDTWTFTFSGDSVVASRRVTTHDTP